MSIYGRGQPWYDKPVRPEKRISKLEHDLDLLPCSDDMCYRCNPDKIVRMGGVETTLKQIYDKEVMLNSGRELSFVPEMKPNHLIPIKEVRRYA